MSAPSSSCATPEIEAGQRFEFGRNWASFLSVLNDDRIRAACESLQQWLGCEDLRGKKFLDVGCGSGLFSLAAHRLGATVHSFDFDPASTACTQELRRRYAAGASSWSVETGSILDGSYLARLGTFDIVYCWGSLHHTGEMWKALEHAGRLVAPGGALFIAIYNDQGKITRRWITVKKLYNGLPRTLRYPLLWGACFKLWWRRILKDFLLGRPFHTWKRANHERGMSAWHDVVDWVGGYPFEVAKPEQVFDFFRDRGFVLYRMKTEGGDLGCNEFVFYRGEAQPRQARAVAAGAGS